MRVDVVISYIEEAKDRQGNTQDGMITPSRSLQSGILPLVELGNHVIEADKK